MFTIIFLLLLGGAALIFISGLKKKHTFQIATGLFLVLAVFLFFQILGFWGEMLWFENLGYVDRFWFLELAQYGFAFAGLLVGVFVVWLLLTGLPAGRRWLRYIAMAFGGVFAMLWGFANWAVVLLFINQVPTSVVDPIFEMPTSFYFFTLPFYKAILGLLFVLNGISVIAALMYVFVAPGMWRQFKWNQNIFTGYAPPAVYDPLFRTCGALLILLAISRYLSRYELLFSGNGVVYGPGWTDVNVRLPMIWLVLGLSVLAGFVLLIPALRNRFKYWLQRRFKWISGNEFNFLVVIVSFLTVVWVVALGFIPGGFQNFKVKPNEISMEEPYIKNNIKFTRNGFNLHAIKERDFPAEDTFTREIVEENPEIFSNIRLWDYRALDAVYQQFQEFRLYYEFEDIDIDRYRYNGQYNQVMIAAREMEVNNLPVQSQTFVNKKFKYTHGFGVVMNNVSEFTASGLPELLIKNIPPVSKYPELTVEEPRIYYGEFADEYIVVNSAEEEFDFPQGDENAYTHYKGKGGVQIKNYWRQFLFAYKFNETKLLFSGYPREESRLMFHRSVRDRIERLAPFLLYDNDPYIVLADGKLHWMLDAYTISANFPYSQPFSTVEDVIIQEEQRNVQTINRIGTTLGNVNYIRNSVKVTVDAYNGDVKFYIFDENDPLIQAWNKTFPGLLKPRGEMPETLLSHIRYPEDLLRIQGIVYAKYHMDDPAVFYNQEDLWVRATEKYFDRVQPVEPYYIMWKLPEEEALSFVLMMPFTPKKRQVLVGWLAGLCDPQNYGELIVYNFPKDQRVIGPQQVETKIDQDPELSSQLTLWDQRGSNVIRGNVLAIPVDKTMFYVEPIYLQAETAAYPELRLVVIMHNDAMAYAPTFEDALTKILIEKNGEAIVETEKNYRIESDTTGIQRNPIVNQRIRAANQAFEDYLQFTGKKDFEKASEALKRLEENLKALEDRN